ncbi:MAG: response regulator, partial [Terriglobales bacterium]
MNPSEISLARRDFRILVVDDDEVSRMLTREMLHFKRYTVTAAGSAEEAAGLIAARPPDLILLDVVMPGRSGIELCRELKAS